MKVERPSFLVRQLEVLHLLALAQSGARLGHIFLLVSFLFRISYPNGRFSTLERGSKHQVWGGEGQLTAADVGCLRLVSRNTFMLPRPGGKVHNTL